MSALTKTGRDAVALAIAEDDRQWRNLERRAEVLARTKMVPKDCQGNAQAVLAAFQVLTEFGVRPSAATLNLLHFIEGRPEPSAQLLAALLGRAGYDIEWTALNPDRAAAHLIQPDGTITIDIEWTITQAEAAGLRDRWVEQRAADGKWPDGNPRWKVERFVLDRDGVTTPDWVAKEVAGDRVKRNENWWRYPDDMLASKVIRRLVKRFAAHITLGVDPDDEPFSSPVAAPAQAAAGEDPTDDVIAAEVVDEPRQASATGGHDDEDLVDQDWVTRFARRIRTFHGEHGHLPVDADELRHAIVRTATQGRTDSARAVRASEAAAVTAWTAMLIDGHARLVDDPDGVWWLAEHDPEPAQ